MSRETEFTYEVLRRLLPFESGAIEDEEIGAASAFLFESFDREDAGPAAR